MGVGPAISITHIRRLTNLCDFVWRGPLPLEHLFPVWYCNALRIRLFRPSVPVFALRFAV